MNDEADLRKGKWVAIGLLAPEAVFTAWEQRSSADMLTGGTFPAKTGHSPDIPEGAITDKSKADFLVGSSVCLQAGWVITQYTTRRPSRLPITLLEINTLGHVTCALVMHWLWCNKPSDVSSLTLTTGP